MINLMYHEMKQFVYAPSPFITPILPDTLIARDKKQNRITLSRNLMEHLNIQGGQKVVTQTFGLIAQRFVAY